MASVTDLTPEERERLKVTTPIAPDAETATATAPGWARWMRECLAGRAAGRVAGTGAGFLYVATAPRDWVPKGGPEKLTTVVIEAERFFDARTLARTLFGPEVEVRPHVGQSGAPMWRTQWQGSALDPRNMPHLAASREGGPWRPLRDL